MNTKTIAAPPAPVLPQQSHRRATYVAAASALVAFLFLGMAAWFYGAVTAALPQVDGNLAVSGLTAPVTVLRDAQGVPHIAAETMEDLLFAQGFTTAQDRLWQMDISRRYGAGELSEVFGRRTLLIDQHQRTLQLRAAAVRAAAALSPRDRRYLEAYAAGVNAEMRQQRHRLPIEFRILGYTPKPWTVEDSLTVGINIIQTLNSQFELEHERESLIAHLSPELVADLYPSSSWRDHPPSAQAQKQQAPPTAQTTAQAKVAMHINAATPSDSLFARESEEDEIACDSCAAGSNNWALSGAHTATGLPLLSNDMHLDHSIPNTWYEVHLTAGGFDVAGVSLPGVPFVIVGHNRRIAWGFTNIGPDVQDLFIENFNASGEYETPSGWQKPEHRRETIKVKGQPEVPLDVQITRHGPVVSDLFPGETRKLALQWMLHEPGAISLPFFEINSAQNWFEFRSAFSHFGGPAQNVVYGDVDGHIGYQATGQIPIRASGDGLLPVPGNDDAHAWIGVVPYEKLPSVYDPPAGVIGTANGRITPDGYPFLLSNQWGAPYRTERIYHALQPNKKFSAADMLALQMDTYSEFDRLVANQLVYAVDHAQHPSARAKQAADLMRGWNGQMGVEAVAPAIAVRSRQQLMRLLLEPKLGQDWKKYKWFSQGVALEKILLEKPRRWLPSGYADFNELLAAAVEKAVNDAGDVAGAVNYAPRDLSTWRWGKLSTVEVKHPVLGHVPLLSHLFLDRISGTGRFPQSGNGSYTVKAAGKTFGASERMTVDFSNLDASTLNIVVGQSGQIFSKHYKDQWNAWYNGKTFNLPFTSKSVEAAAVHRLRLEPAK